jgi:hypothetical protein
MFNYFMKLLFFLYVCMLFCYVLMCPLSTYVLTSWVYVPYMGVQCNCSRFYIFSGGAWAAVCHKVRVMFEIWCCMCQCMYCSHASYSYWFYICDIIPGYSNVCPSFLSLWHPWYLSLFRMYAICSVYGLTIWNCCCCFWWCEYTCENNYTECPYKGHTSN